MGKKFKIVLIILLFVVLLFALSEFLPGFKDGFMTVVEEMN